MPLVVPNDDSAERVHPEGVATPRPGQFTTELPEADETPGVPAATSRRTHEATTRDVQDEPSPSERSMMWIWPAVLIVVIAVSGQLFGPLGVLLSGVGLTSTIVLFASRRVEGFPRKWLLPIIVAVSLLVTAAILAAQYGLLTNRPVGASSTIFTRGVPSAEQLRETPSPGIAVQGIKLDDQNLRGARLPGASAPGASLEDTILEDARLAGADLRGANLRGARLSGADLRGVDFTGADLRGAVLTNTCLRGADLTGAVTNDLDATGAAVEGAVVSESQTSAAKAWPTSASPVPGACPR